jgi:two-component system LytT family sensor kinase
MNRLRRFMRSPSFWPLQIAGWATYGVMIIASYWSMLAPGVAVGALIQVKSARTLVGFTLTCGLRLLLRRFTSGSAAVARTGAIVLAAVVVGGPLWLLVMDLIFPPKAPATGAELSTWVSAPRAALDYSLTLLCWSALYLGLRGWRELQDQRARALEAAGLAQQAQLDALRYQLNPHFLFNSLNSIRALIDEDAGRARRMITALSEFLRYPLTSAAAIDVPLATELDALRNYLAIEQIRFEDRLRVTIDVGPDAEAAAMPSLLLLPLVENAIKHGFSTLPGGTLALRVAGEVRDGQVWLEVANTGSWQPTHAAAERLGTGTGLRNVQSRLTALAPSAHHFSVQEEDGSVIVRIALPYRPVSPDDPRLERHNRVAPSTAEADDARQPDASRLEGV